MFWTYQRWLWWISDRTNSQVTIQIRYRQMREKREKFAWKKLSNWKWLKIRTDHQGLKKRFVRRTRPGGSGSYLLGCRCAGPAHTSKNTSETSIKGGQKWKWLVLRIGTPNFKFYKIFWGETLGRMCWPAMLDQDENWTNLVEFTYVRDWGPDPWGIRGSETLYTASTYSTYRT